MLGVNVVIQDEQGRVLLMQREDFEVWCTPGGLMEKGETPAAAAIREAKEETGLDVRLTRLVGVYSREMWRGDDYHIFVFAGVVTGGTLTPQEGEALQVGWFAPDALPELLIGQAHRIQAAAEGLSGIACMEHLTPSLLADHLTRWDIYRLRDESGLSRVAFYRQMYPVITQIDILMPDGTWINVTPEKSTP